MKKTTFILMILLALSTLSSVTTKAAVVISVETPESCAAGTDNDGDFLTGVADPDCAAFAVTEPQTSSVTAETAASCAAGTDNDGDFLTGVADPDCAAFSAPATTTVSSTTAETAASCAAGTDNDGDFLTGVADPDCAAFSAPATTTTPVTPVSGGGGVVGSSFGGGSSSGSSFGSGITSGTPISTVITSTSTCADAFQTYMKKGQKNNVNEVKKLQKLLNVKATGFFGNLTLKAVKAFQLKYTTNVLAPWGINHATGYFYKTTQRQANMLLCPNVNFPMPVLN